MIHIIDNNVVLYKVLTHPFKNKYRLGGKRMREERERERRGTNRLVVGL